MSYSDRLWKLFCIASVVGIWPQFIEPRLLVTQTISLKIPGLEGLKIVQFSDLHFQASTSSRFLDKLERKIKAGKPDLIVFTGDFLCYGELSQPERLEAFLRRFEEYPCYAILGNHDYAQFVSLNETGEFDVVPKAKSQIKRALCRLIENPTVTGRATVRAKAVGRHRPLLQLLEKTPFRLLENETCQITLKERTFNLTGLGEYNLGRVNSLLAFARYDKSFPGIVMLHNPDAIPLLNHSPGELILSGHTHGGQINLPGLWQRFTLMEHPRFKSGYVHHRGRHHYISRGVGGVVSFRVNAVPEVTHFQFV